MRHYLFGIFFFFMLILPFSTQVEAQEVSTASDTLTIVQSEEETMDPPEVTGIMSEEEKVTSSTEQMPVNAEPVVLNNEASVQADSEQNQETHLTGQSKLMEASKISVDSSLQGNVEYRVHVQTYGWQNWQKDGQEAGTVGKEDCFYPELYRLESEKGISVDRLSYSIPDDGGQRSQRIQLVCGIRLQ